eukprot:g5525.t1
MAEDCLEWHVPCLRRVAISSSFGILMMGMILANTVVLAMDRYPIDQGTLDTLEFLNFLFSLVFVAELLVKLPGLGVRLYLADGFNRFDLVIVLAGVVELPLAPPFLVTGVRSTATQSGLSALRVFRVARIFKLARGWTQLQQVLVVVANTLGGAGYFAVLLFLFMFIYALLGRQFFANRFYFDVATGRAVPIGAPGYFDPHLTERPRSNFDSFIHSIATIFQVLTGEDWQFIMYDAMRCAALDGKFFEGAAAFYFVSLVFLGNYIMLNLFLAIILGNFGTEKKSADDVQAEASEPWPQWWGGTAWQVRWDEFNAREGWFTRKWNVFMRTRCYSAMFGSCHPSAEEQRAGARRVFCCVGRANPVRRAATSVVSHRHFDNTILVFIVLSTVGLALDNPLMDPRSPMAVALFWIDLALTVIFFFEMVLKIASKGLVLVPAAYLHDPWNILDFVIVIVSVVSTAISPQWALQFPPPATAEVGTGAGGEAAAAGGGGLSSLRTLRMLRALRPLRMINRAPGLKLVVTALLQAIPGVGNVLIVCLFMFIVIAILSIGFFKGLFYQCDVDGGGPWLGSGRVPFTDADLIDQAVALIEKPMPWAEMAPAQRGFFVNRTLAPVAADAAGGAGVLGGISCPFNATVLPSAATGFDVQVAAWSRAAGADHTDSSSDSVASLPSSFPLSVSSALSPTSRELCGCFGRKWVPVADNSFNDIFTALETLFEMASTEGWVAVMYHAVDCTEQDMQPLRDHAIGWSIYFMLFMVVGHMFTLNLFVGVIIDQFQKTKEKLGGRGLITEEQEAWIKIRLLVEALRLPSKPPPLPRLQCRRPFHRVSLHPYFDAFIMTIIIVNTLCMCLTFYGMPPEMEDALLVCNYVFAAIYNIEAVVKIVGLGPRLYFAEGWNVFDFFIVVSADAGMVLSWAGVADQVAALATVIRTFRVGRIFRIARQLSGIRRLFNTLILATPALTNIGGVILLLYFIYGVIGVQVFAKVGFEFASKAADEDEGDSQLNDRVNFRSFGNSLLLLFRVSTGEGWNAIMHQLKRKPEKCVADPSFDPDVCGFNAWANPADTIRTPMNCTALRGCGTADTPIVYFFSFTLLGTFVVVNLFVAVILEGFEDTGEAVITQDGLDKYKRIWHSYDPGSTQLVDVTIVAPLLRDLPVPMGFGGMAKRELPDRVVEARMERLNLHPTPQCKIHFLDMAAALARLVVMESYEISEKTMKQLVEDDAEAEKEKERIAEEEAAQKSEHHLQAQQRRKKKKGAGDDEEEKGGSGAAAIALSFRPGERGGGGSSNDATGSDPRAKRSKSRGGHRQRARTLLRQVSRTAHKTVNMQKVVATIKIQRVFRQSILRKSIFNYLCVNPKTGMSPLVYKLQFIRWHEDHGVPGCDPMAEWEKLDKYARVLQKGYRVKKFWSVFGNVGGLMKVGVQ